MKLLVDVTGTTYLFLGNWKKKKKNSTNGLKLN